MAPFLMVAVAAAIFVSMFMGCTWVLPYVIVAILLGALGYWSWVRAGVITAAPGGFNTWWTANRQRVTWAAAIFTTVLLLGAAAWCGIKRYAPPCTGGCGSAAVTAPVSRAAAAHAVTSNTFIVSAGPEWTEAVEVPMSDTSEIRWERVDQNTAYQFQTQDGVPVTRYAGPVPYTNHGRVQRVQFRSTDPNPVLIRVKVVE